MRKAFGGALCAALAGGLALAATSAGTERVAHTQSHDGLERAARAIDSYRGAFKQAGPNTKVTIKVKTRNGEAKAVRSLTYRRLPATCDVSKNVRIADAWIFRGFKVNDRRRFSIVGEANDGSTINFSGRFSKTFKKVKGRFQSDIVFPPPGPPPAQTCVTPNKPYSAKR